jgi:dTDP-4-amino-4,6-dideoxygalactose transaminase
MTEMKDREKQYADGSGRGQVIGYKVNFPARMFSYTEEEIELVGQVMRNADCLTQGKYQQQFERDVAEYTGARHSFAVDNCTNALRLAAILCGLKPGDEVIIPAYTFCATAIPFANTGARIVWADIDPATRLISPEDVASKVTARTRVIVAVHLLGMPVDMDPILEIAVRHNLKVVEDCAQAPGAAYKGRKVGSIGDFGCFSFQAAKNITTLGEGGALTVRSDEDARHVPGLRHNGIHPFSGERSRYWVPAMTNVDVDLEGVWPNNFCLGEVQCALGSALLKRLDSINQTLRKQAAWFRDRLSGCAEISFQHVPDQHFHVYHALVLSFDGSANGKTRDDFMDLMTAEFRIRMIVQYHPLYRYPLFQKMGLGEADCPNLNRYWPTSCSFPWWAGMTDDTVEYLAGSAIAAAGKLRRAAAA